MYFFFFFFFILFLIKLKFNKPSFNYYMNYYILISFKCINQIIFKINRFQINFESTEI